ncbi:MAG: hypothetical protein Q8M16_14620 [Pirellulaceae bacterium]|nr:hypothetical protein [Pirellulaceae bacterium]
MKHQKAAIFIFENEPGTYCGTVFLDDVNVPCFELFMHRQYAKVLSVEAGTRFNYVDAVTDRLEHFRFYGTRAAEPGNFGGEMIVQRFFPEYAISSRRSIDYPTSPRNKDTVFKNVTLEIGGLNEWLQISPGGSIDDELTGSIAGRLRISSLNKSSRQSLEQIETTQTRHLLTVELEFSSQKSIPELIGVVQSIWRFFTFLSCRNVRIADIILPRDKGQSIRYLPDYRLFATMSYKRFKPIEDIWLQPLLSDGKQLQEQVGRCFSKWVEFERKHCKSIEFFLESLLSPHLSRDAVFCLIMFIVESLFKSPTVSQSEEENNQKFSDEVLANCPPEHKSRLTGLFAYNLSRTSFFDKLRGILENLRPMVPQIDELCIDGIARNAKNNRHALVHNLSKNKVASGQELDFLISLFRIAIDGRILEEIQLPKTVVSEALQVQYICKRPPQALLTGFLFWAGLHYPASTKGTNYVRCQCACSAC